MKILLVHNNYLIQGGAEVFYHDVGRVLIANGHSVAFFSARDDAAESCWSSYFPNVAKYNQGGLIRKAMNFPKTIYNYEAKSKFAKLLKDFNPDIIHVFAIYVQLTPSILDAAREADIPVVMSCNDYKLICPNYKLFHDGIICEKCLGGKYYSAVSNLCCHGSPSYSIASAIEAYVHKWLNIYRKNVHTFLFASEFMAFKTEEFWGKNAFRWNILRNPFDSTKHNLIGPVGDYALFFGRLIEEKGVDILIEAASLVPNLPIVIIGDGPDREKVVRGVEKLHNVKFLGPKWGDELNGWLQAARFVVVPSLWHENYPYVIFQAFAAGKPVLGTNRGGIPELVANGERGWIYEATDVTALAAGLRQAACVSDSDIVRMGEQARGYVKSEFNDNVFFIRLMEIYKGVLS